MIHHCIYFSSPFFLGLLSLLVVVVVVAETVVSAELLNRLITISKMYIKYMLEF